MTAPGPPSASTSAVASSTARSATTTSLSSGAVPWPRNGRQKRSRRRFNRARARPSCSLGAGLARRHVLVAHVDHARQEWSVHVVVAWVSRFRQGCHIHYSFLTDDRVNRP